MPNKPRFRNTGKLPRVLRSSVCPDFIKVIDKHGGVTLVYHTDHSSMKVLLDTDYDDLRWQINLIIDNILKDPK